MSLAPGTRIGPYEVLGPLGAGGMGEVYRARDARLERDVALKVLPQSFGRDADRLARFEREARAVAALSHPNILAVFDTGTTVPVAADAVSGPAHPVAYVVMELLTGETLGDRVKSGPLPVRKATEVASLIARGLAAAHEKGLVHRDLKPDNVFLTSDGQVKLLDFGLARYATEPNAAHATRSAITDAGTVMGTVGYMAPEQVRGEVVDARADLFALGAVLYEMLTGERAFRRETGAETMTAILNEDPPEFPPVRAIAPALDRIVRHCLEKQPSERFQTARDVAFALESLSVSSSSAASVPALAEAPARPRVGRERLAWLVGTLALATLAAWLAMKPKAADGDEPPVIRASLALPRGTRLANRPPGRRIAVSPDGRRIAFLTQPTTSEAVTLWVQGLDSATAAQVPGTRAPEAPFWSPDGRYLGFLDDGQLMRMPVDGGAPASVGANSGLPSWGPDDRLLVWESRQLVRIITPDGTNQVVLSSPEEGEAFLFPTFLPGGQGLLFTLAHPHDPTRTGTYVSDLAGANRRQVLQGNPELEASNVFFAAGHLLTVRDRMVQARRFDPGRAALEGEWAVVAGPVDGQERGSAAYAVSSALLAYQPATTDEALRLVWYDRRGQAVGQLGADGDYSNLELSPDRTRLLVSLPDPQTRTRDIWTLDLRRGIPTRATFDPVDERSAVWGADGQSIVYRKGVDLYTRPVGGGPEEPLVVDGLSKDPRGWSPDGLAFVYRVSVSSGNSDLWLKPASGPPRALITSPFTENYAEFSPDGRWLAYVSEESGAAEVYVTSFPAGQGKWRVSPNGGTLPRWRADGRELYYMSLPGEIMAVPVNAIGPSFEADVPTMLFPTRMSRAAGYQYIVTADGSRFLINETLPRAGTPSIEIVANWPALLNGASRK